MKYFDTAVVLIAFALSTIVTASLFAGFAYWAFAELGAVQQDIVATALRAPALAQHANVAQAAADLPVVQLAPITVIGHRSEGEAFASAATSTIR